VAHRRHLIYIRSFADGTGDGTGDIAGIRSRLPYLAGLGVDAIWITPWYPSPMADGGYDVADYQDIAPEYGDLAEAGADSRRAPAQHPRPHRPGTQPHLRQAPWFQRAVAAGPGSRRRSRSWFRPGRGAGGGLPPNDWQSVFGGSAWTRLPASETQRDPEWYLHPVTFPSTRSPPEPDRHSVLVPAPLPHGYRYLAIRLPAHVPTGEGDSQPQQPSACPPRPSRSRRALLLAAPAADAGCSPRHEWHLKREPGRTPDHPAV
jgi:hypothetical protein